MENPRKLGWGAERKVFDPRDASTGSGGEEVLDPSVVRRSEQWWMYLAGQSAGHGAQKMLHRTLHPSMASASCIR
jgi:hypothetical protein